MSFNQNTYLLKDFIKMELSNVLIQVSLRLSCVIIMIDDRQNHALDTL